MTPIPPNDDDLRARAAELCRRAADLRARAANLRSLFAQIHPHVDLDPSIADIMAGCVELDDCSRELDACAGELNDHAQRWEEERTPLAAKQMTLVQVDVAKRIVASADGLIRPIGSGRWGIERRRRGEEWSVGVVTVRAMEGQGWLERSRQHADPWRDPRRLTEAGKAALAAGPRPGKRVRGP